jgi:hypothetical protein
MHTPDKQCVHRAVDKEETIPTLGEGDRAGRCKRQ